MFIYYIKQKPESLTVHKYYGKWYWNVYIKKWSKKIKQDDDGKNKAHTKRKSTLKIIDKLWGRLGFTIHSVAFI